MYPEDKRIRETFIGIEETVKINNGKFTKSINFDNAATTPAFKKVLESVNNFIPYYGSVSRGEGFKSKVSTDIYEKSREKILELFSLSGRTDYEVIYVKNATEGLNKLSNRLITSINDLVISTRMEHHSNDLPWRGKCRLDYIEVDEYGRLSLDDIEKKLKENEGQFKYLTITGASNVTGYVNPVNKIAKLVHKYGGKIIVDGAQLIPHEKVNMAGLEPGEEIDYLVFSAHKMYAPFGIGVIVALKEGLIHGEPDYKGGGTVNFVTDDNVIWGEGSSRDEAGTPNLLGVIALLAAIDEINKISYRTIEKREEWLTRELLRGLNNIGNIDIYGYPYYDGNRLGIGAFNVRGLWHGHVASLLSELGGISVRNGCFCAQPYVQRLLNIDNKTIEEHFRNPHRVKEGMVRVSFGVYNTLDEVWRFLNILEYIAKNYK